MKPLKQPNLSLLLLTALLAVGTRPAAYAAEPESAAEQAEDAAAAAATAAAVRDQILPYSTIRLGLGHLDGNAVRYGQFTGANDMGAVTRLGLDLQRRDEATGTWLRLDGKHLTQEYRELRFEHERQGEWKYFLDYSRLPRYVPLAITTGLSGIGSALQQVNGSAPREVELGTVRDAVTVGLQLKTASAFETQLRFRQEEKTGARPFGTGEGVDGAARLYFLTEPIDSVSKELEASLAYTGQDLQLLGAYLGSWYGNRNRAAIANGAAVNGLAPAQISLPLDNAAQQLSLSGGYSWTPTTRATFKASYERATQDETFHDLSAGSSLVAGQRLDGRVDTTLLQAGISAQPLERLALLVNLRHEDRNDRTPLRQYLTPSVGFPHALNTRYSQKLSAGKAEATYRLSREHSLAVGLDHDRRQREVPPSIPFTDPAAPAQARQVSFRTDTEETGYRLEFRRALTEAVNGSLAHVRSRRSGSSLLPADNSASPDFVAPIQWADRERAKWRLAVDWVPSEPVTVQLVVEDSDDTYSGLALGPRRGGGRLYSLDLSYALSDDWQVTGWLTETTSRAEQATCGAINPRDSFCTVATRWLQWQARLDDRTQALGLGLRGSPSRKLKLGADLQYAEERNAFGFDVLAASAADLPSGLPPAILYKSTNLVAFIEYALAGHSGWRFDYVYQRVRSNDWTWDLVDATGASLYADGTTVDLAKDVSTQFFGVSYFYRWR
ncbi:MAG TPA: MtrB/PioB family decaheme-associated outer membrane protein [Rhodocyclaceae bacterium]|nr:MtrB/PioB family decaheme-associated outer membrane protein [Rhodocyclaceae bacterium]